ncbi:FAS-associated factor 2-like [Dreissena polymorpha]|uniref:FAS-associated factor 2-like n=1 Tax=Dreissena polymorpha TaxID=45954 RepID=UPI00226523B9|nr:FAS-associated factor 2-like [Dreissena polymorpha]
MTLTEKIAIVNTEMSGTYTTGTTKITETEETLIMMVFTVQPRSPQGIVQWSYYILTFPFRFLYSTLLDIFRFAFQFLRVDPRRNVTDPVGDVTQFISLYNEKYGARHPVFYQGSYSHSHISVPLFQALNDAKQELKFLLVYLHGKDHQDSDGFCRNTLGNEDLIRFVDTSMLFWACDTNSPEGYRVSQALRENRYPFLALIVLRQSRMTVVARIEGLIEPGYLINRLEVLMSDNESSLVAARADREERNFNQSLRQQQDEAYQESLRVDQEKERKKREEKEQELRELEKQRRMKKEHQNMLQYLYYFTFCHDDCPDDFHIVTNFPRKTLPCEPTSDNPEPISFEKFGLRKNEMLFVQDNEA